MTISSIGNYHLLGNCQYANSNINYPDVNIFSGFPHDSISSGIASLCTAAGLQYRDVLPQAEFDSLSQTFNIRLLSFGLSGDINDRYTFGIRSYTYELTTALYGGSALFSDLGDNSTGTTFNDNSALAKTNMTSLGIELGLGTKSDIFWAGCATINSLALFVYQYNFNTNKANSTFWYAGELDPVNADFNYYSASRISKSVVILSAKIFNNTGTSFVDILDARHYIGSQQKNILRTGDGDFPITCADAQTPINNWRADNFYVYEDNPTLGSPFDGPYMGEPYPLKVAQGNYIIGQPVTKTGDPSGLAWLPVGQWTATKTLFMPCKLA